MCTICSTLLKCVAEQGRRWPYPVCHVLGQVETSGGKGGCTFLGSSPAFTCREKPWAQQAGRWQRASGLGGCWVMGRMRANSQPLEVLGKNHLVAQAGQREHWHNSGRRWKLLGWGQVWGEGPVLSSGVHSGETGFLTFLLAQKSWVFSVSKVMS